MGVRCCGVALLQLSHSYLQNISNSKIFSLLSNYAKYIILENLYVAMKHANSHSCCFQVLVEPCQNLPKYALLFFNSILSTNLAITID